MFKVHKFFKGLLFIVIFLLVYLMSISPLILNIGLMMILLSGVFIDKRFNWKGRLIMLIVLIAQLLVYYYLKLIPIIIIKDLFWFSLVLNLSFIWHVLILHWGFEISDYYKNDYGRFLFSRLSVISSLTMMYWILNWISFLMNWIEFYYHWIFNFKAALSELNSIELFIYEYIYYVNPILNVIIAIFKAIIIYFMGVFNNYSLLIMGKKSYTFLKQPLKFYILFIILFMISIYLMIPRLYIMWLILLIIKFITVIFKLYCFRVSYVKKWDNWPFKLWFVFLRDFILCEELNKGLHINWDEIYNKEYYLDYLLFCDTLDWFFRPCYDLTPYNLYDIFEVFFYNKERRVLIVSNFCAFTDDYQDYYITEYNLGITLKELEKLCHSRVTGIPSWYNLPNRRSISSKTRVTLYLFIKLEKGHYY